MKKIKKFLLGNIKTVVAFILGIIMSVTTVYAATILYNSNQVEYDNTSSGMSATNVQDALDELSTKANTWIDPSYIDFTTLATNKNKTILASSAGMCIKRNNKVICMKNNWIVEKVHLPQVFSDASCYVYSSRVDCEDSAFRCFVNDYGNATCYDYSDYSSCVVDGVGNVYCY